MVCIIIYGESEFDSIWSDWTAKSIVAGSFGADLDRSDLGPASISCKRVLRSRLIRTQTPRYYFIDTQLSPRSASEDSTAKKHTGGEKCKPCNLHLLQFGELVFKHFMEVTVAWL